MMAGSSFNLENLYSNLRYRLQEIPQPPEWLYYLFIAVFVCLIIFVAIYYSPFGLRFRARHGNIPALVRLTRKLVRKSSEARREARELLGHAIYGVDWAMYAIGQRMRLDNDETFKQDAQISKWWLHTAALYGNIEAIETIQHEAVSGKTKGPLVTTLDKNRDPMSELDGMIGLSSIKKSVREIASRAHLFEKREAVGLTAGQPALHLVFMGNPGTGKTVVARIIGRILKDAGYLKKGHVVEVSAPDLIGQFVGETPQKVQSCVTRALDGVLFIDEAYGITGFGTSSGNSFGSEAVTTLLKMMEDNRDRLVVIAAGYPNEMHNFLETNPGFRSRFTDIINFPDYTADELVEICVKLAHEQQYEFDKEGLEVLREIMTLSKSLFAKNFANGRFVRNIFEASIKSLATRVEEKNLTSRHDLSLITAADIINAFTEENQRRNPGSTLRLDLKNLKQQASNIVAFHKDADRK